VTLRMHFIMATLFASGLAYAGGCGDAVALLGNEREQKHSVSREELVKEMAQFFSTALQDKSHAEAFDHKLRAMAEALGEPVGALSKEIEALAESPVAQREMRDEREATRAAEKARLYLGLEPYLDRISKAHRRVIERELIDRDLVSPLSTGEVEFKFVGPHRVLIGDEDYWGESERRLKEVVFGPKDSFALGQVPVTQLMYFLAAIGRERVMPTPSGFREGEGGVVFSLGGREWRLKPNHPVEQVNFEEALAHAARVSEILDGNYSLPSELKWEFANRAGSSDWYHFGYDEPLLSRYGWFYRNSGEQTHAVGELLPNGYGLYDTHGNVWEWTLPKDGLSHVTRGGSWLSEAGDVRSAYRALGDASVSDGTVGFRLERTGHSKAQPSYPLTLGEAKPGPLEVAKRIAPRRSGK
jgi:hypothetical protein